MIMKDGHFGLQRFSKVDDPDDISILQGAGFFPPDAEYNDFVRNVVAYSDEVCVGVQFIYTEAAESSLENYMFQV